MCDIDLYQKYAEQIQEKVGKKTSDFLDAYEIIRVCKDARKKKYKLGNYYIAIAKMLFDKHNIEDEKLEKNILESVEFEFEGDKYKTEVRYVAKGLSKFPDESRYIQNSLHKPDEEFVTDSLKRCMKRFPNTNATVVYLWKDCVMIFTND